ncbi:RelA/SpoT domain-containing protein [Nocardia puris]|uniref:GTP pyrophosphokinase n=1 Tax=Nocardia puris TaxID=208602 RepID=UPI00189442FD|nr:RelA/SpoT domain-containing protein [Nocardia puris]MBF6213929.1 RelA/SpoT domain-containing protein [Nocardia puris]MBF6463055.1 RelA/SpoT domain-containing protein [Nocardia puris]
MDVIEDFVSRYTREIDFYQNVAQRASDLLESELKKEGVRCTVSRRAKSVDRLEEKCRKRNSKRDKPYESVHEIYEDIVDLAGARVALYFPSDIKIVASAIYRLFDVLGDPKKFPESGGERQGNPRFSGYAATHFRVMLKESRLTNSHKRYADAKVEIQVASVFMHGWSEVEHDLVYKPQEGDLSEEEYALLDQLNGLAISAEIALERLQKANERRVADLQRAFRDHYELSTYLLSKLGISDQTSVNDSGLGRMDHLFNFITALALNTPLSISRYVDLLHDKFEERPLADQVIDALLAEDEHRYNLYQEIRHGNLSEQRALNEALGRFLSTWVGLERITAQLMQNNDSGRRYRVPDVAILRELQIVDDPTYSELRSLRTIRNQLVHGRVVGYPPSDIERATNRVIAITDEVVRNMQRMGMSMTDSRTANADEDSGA